MTDQEYDINWVCNRVVSLTDTQMFDDDFKQWILQITDAARKYVKLKEALK